MEKPRFPYPIISAASYLDLQEKDIIRPASSFEDSICPGKDDCQNEKFVGLLGVVQKLLADNSTGGQKSWEYAARPNLPLIYWGSGSLAANESNR